MDAAERFLDAPEIAIHRLSDMPRIGIERDFESSRTHGVRRWPVGGFQRYLILHRFTGDSIEVIRVIHSARDIEALFDD